MVMFEYSNKNLNCSSVRELLVPIQCDLSHDNIFFIGLLPIVSISTNLLYQTKEMFKGKKS